MVEHLEKDGEIHNVTPQESNWFKLLPVFKVNRTV